jgi:hypothetical protein
MVHVVDGSGHGFWHGESPVSPVVVSAPVLHECGRTSSHRLVREWASHSIEREPERDSFENLWQCFPVETLDYIRHLVIVERIQSRTLGQYSTPEIARVFAPIRLEIVVDRREQLFLRTPRVERNLQSGRPSVDFGGGGLTKVYGMRPVSSVGVFGHECVTS